MTDKVKKGRAFRAYGELNGQSLLTKEQIIAIRDDVRTYRAIGLDYGIGSGHVSDIKNRKKWASVA